MPFTGGAQAWFAEAVEQLTFPYSWLSGNIDDFARWRLQAQARLTESLGLMPPLVPLLVVTIKEEDRGTYTAVLLEFAVAPSCRTSAYVLAPKGPGPFPAVLALHDHGGCYLWGKEKLVRSPNARHPVLAEHVRLHYGGRYLADALAERGYIVLVVDQWLWGQQRVADVPSAANLDLTTAEGVRRYHRLVREFERLMAVSLVYAGSSEVGRRIWTDQRSLELLLQHPRVDPQRVGCVGLSVGGLRSFHLAALDDRIQAAVVVGWMCDLKAFLRLGDPHAHGAWGIGLCAPGMLRYLDFPDVASLACPRPLLLIHGRNDNLFPIDVVEEAFRKIWRVYATHQAEDHLETRWYDVAHCFDLSMQVDAFAWLDRWLNPRPGPAFAAG